MTEIQENFIRFILPHALEGVGRQHPWMVRWAISKACRECGWNIENALIKKANNCLGIKAGEGRKVFPGIPMDQVVWVQDSTKDGRNDGLVAWRRFATLADCFAYFVRILNTSQHYQTARNAFLIGVENIYTANTPGHAMGILAQEHEVFSMLATLNLIDEKGRFVA